ncbi:MAG: excisionase family DNA-binding protein [Planctomycetia bacterium]|nr:excisionase family DNA-binding protein [Planctomycetia bacterium]
MSKKYLSIEEAAEQLGISTSELNRLREKGSIRAFADRGTWKFKEEDVETLGRSREADSNPDVPLMPDESSVMDDEDVLGSQATVIRKGGSDDSSDSDVRLIFDDSMKVEEPGAAPLLDDSDSDVKLAPSAAGSNPDSDSDVKLAGSAPAGTDAGSDSDVKLVTDDLPVSETSGSDSDVRLVSSESSGEVKMTGSSGDVIPLAGDDDSAVGVDSADSSSEASVVGGDSGISLGEGSGIALASDSGISLERPNDSGISLSAEHSILLEADSGISLAGDVPLKSDSGISLAPKPADKKKKGPGKKEATQGDDDLSGTVPLMDVPAAPAEDLLDTQMEVPSLSDSSESEDLFASSGGDSTNVITLDDEEEQAGYDVTADIPVEGSAAVEDEEEVVSAEEDEEPVEISDDLVGEDDELTEDVFGAEDEDFASDDLESGESSSELPVAPRGMVAAAEQEWGTGVHVTLVISTVLTVLCGTVVFDMVRNMWHTDVANHNPLATMFVDMLKNM